MSAVKIHHTQSLSRSHSPASSRRNSFDADYTGHSSGPSRPHAHHSSLSSLSHHQHHHHAAGSSAGGMGAHHRPAYVHASSSLALPGVGFSHHHASTSSSSSAGSGSSNPHPLSYPQPNHHRFDDLSQAVASAIAPVDRPYREHAPSSLSSSLFTAVPEKESLHAAAEYSHPLAPSNTGTSGQAHPLLSQKYIAEHRFDEDEHGEDAYRAAALRPHDPAAVSLCSRSHGHSDDQHARHAAHPGGAGGVSGKLHDALASKSKELRTKIMGKGQDGIGRALLLGWVVTTLGFLVATAFWRGQLFGALDRLSKDLFALGLEGKLIFGFLIFVTTIPPLPLYSTLMVLAGYTFGVWEGFVVSYMASITGAVLVFVVSRTVLRDTISKLLAGSPTAQTLLNIIPANPHLLLLIRIAPYPYNLLNVILASAPSLTLRTYTACTAFSLLKLVLHTWIGAGIHDLSATYVHDRGASAPPADGSDTLGESEGSGGWAGAGDALPDTQYPDGDQGWHRPHGPGRFGEHGYGHHRYHHHHHNYHHHPPAWMVEEMHRQKIRMYSTWVGIALCVALFFYLTHLAKKALAKAQAEAEERDEELGMRQRPA